MMEEETPMPTSASDPVHAPAHYAGDGKIECKAAMAAEEQSRRPQESARMHRYRAFARRGVKEETKCQ